MFATAEQLSSTNKILTETVQSLFNTLFTTVERISALNLNTSRAALESSINNTRALLLCAKDPQALLNLAPMAGPAAIEKMTAYSREVYEILNKAQEETSQTLERQAAEHNHNVTEFLDKAAKSAPAGSDVAVAAVRSAIAAANSAYDSLQKAGKQVAGIVEANVAATAKAVDAAASTAASSATAKANKDKDAARRAA